MNNIVSNKIPNIFLFLLEVKSIDDCIKYFNENISPENKEKIKGKKFKINNKDFLNISEPFFKEESKPTRVLGNLHLPNFDIEFEKTLSQELKKVQIPDLIHKKMFELTDNNIIHLFRLFVLPLFIKCFFPLTYSYDSYFLLYNRKELEKYMKKLEKMIDYERIPILDGLKFTANLIIENDKKKFSESDSIIIKKFKDYLSKLKKKDLTKLYEYFKYADIVVNFLDKHISRIIDNIIKGSTRAMIDKIEINYAIMIQFFFILFLIDNLELFIHLQNFFIEIQKECNFNELYILYYKLKYIEEQISSINTNTQLFYTSVYDYLVYKLYLHIQRIVEPAILKIIKDFELKYTFVDALIEKQLKEEQLAEEKQLKEEQLKEEQLKKEKLAEEQLKKEQLAEEKQLKKEQLAKEQLKNNKLKQQQSVNNIPSKENNTNVVSIENTSLNNILNKLNKKLEKIKGKPLNNEIRNEIKNIDDIYSLIVLLKNEYQNEYKDKKKLLKKILHLLKKNNPDLRNNYINSVKKISDFLNLFNNTSRKIFNLKKVFNYLIDAFHITNEDIIEAINSEKYKPHYNNIPPPYSSIYNSKILQVRPK